MAVFIVRRLIISVFTLLAASYLVYVGTALSGDPLQDLYGIQDEGDAQTQMDARRRAMNLDVPVFLRYFLWLGDLLQGDLGQNKFGQSVSGILGPAIWATLQLVIAATVLAIILGVMIGIISALRQYSGFDYTLTFAAFLFYSLPVFWVAVMLKQFGAIEFNDWLREPRIPLPIIVLVALLAGLAWMAIIGGNRERRVSTFAIAAVATGGLLWALSETGWFEDPGLGFVAIVVLALSAALGSTLLIIGFRYRPPVIATLSTAAVGCVFYLFSEPVLEDPSWPVILLLAVIAVGVGLGIGYVVGGLQRRQAMAASALTAFLTGGVIFVDYMLQAYSGYYDIVRGRPVSTIGAATPNFEGSFWESSLDTAGHLILPTLALLLISFAVYTRYTRASMLEVMNQDYVRTARSKGLTERTVVTKHAFRNALIPVTTLMAFDFGAVIGGAVITEGVFGWKGMGQMFIDGLREVDPPPVMAFFLVAGGSVVVFNMLADIAYGYLDPRIRVS
ncbi:ABC transporter permease [Actinobacteria bacterium YIM 96077]|uniref:ABC transporter permease n=1 Tax=Phytoactinopolyspora halophila TaxID=1981511 RepID=A0A329QS54_9ACTN|nr:ABC transporter permease [Phytoactinopolyspora halophila]AYY14328.1 ABC transporter permease [Actinobacteria bacterium YIM 96077]RAW14871.1 ABC transporter permease [Phytoactinopolyspora halophila]